MPTREQTILAWTYVTERALQCFSLYSWKVRIAPFYPNGRDQYAAILENAAVESTLMSVRDLDSFFGQRRQADDLIADDYQGFTNLGRFLSTSERASLNKKLAHLTYASVLEQEANGIAHNPRIWDSAELVTRAIERVLTLLSYLETNYLVYEPGWPTRLANERRALTALLTNMNLLARAELEITE